MVQTKNPDYPSRKRRRVLLVGIDRTSRDRVTTMLNTMGWTCSTVSGQDEALATIVQESFDAVLLDVGQPDAQTEQAIQRIAEIRPSLSKRIVAISSGSVDPQTQDLIERHSLPHLTQERLLVRLMITLEDLFISSGPRQVAPRNVHTARLLFDSFAVPSPAGLRSARASGRHFTYEHNHTMVDVFVDCPAGTGRIVLMGHVLESAREAGRGDGLPVVVIGRTRTLARTTTNRLGEFLLEFDFAENISLEIRLRERTWLAIPLGSMNWLTKQMQSQATGT
jgi:CheY-like chemotaxis protein